MKTWWTFLILLVFCVVLATSETTSKSPRTRRPRDPNCEKVLPLRPLSPGLRAKCTFLCQGFPVRVGHEPDGTPCDRRGKKRAPGLCRNGKCIRPDEFNTSPAFSTPNLSTAAPKQ
uniref:Putative secreted protein midgut overexpressed n=1 Tax=Rhipicephalus microplus TaxID=6941 RepID=A0A6M2CGI6_RHIMP|nr:uncharacterized protein LOC119171383 [Rhipicephalus microplus]